jgi:hypothetical protein
MLFAAFWQGINVTACSALIPMKVIGAVGKLDENLKGVDDYDFWLRISQHIRKFALSESVCSWRVSKRFSFC